MFGKLLTKAKSLFRSSPSPAPEQVEPLQESSPPTAVAVKPEAPVSPKAPEEKEKQADEVIIGDVLHYEEGSFSFTLPLEEEERHVLKEAKEKYEEAKTRLKEEETAWGKKQLEHLKAMQYWSLQIFYRDRAQHYYKRRNEDPDALKQAILYCEKQIAFAPMAIRANQMNPQSKELPQHYGYKQLAIIHEKQGRYDETIRLCRQALEQGWKGDWEVRIQRIKKKKDKESSNT